MLLLLISQNMEKQLQGLSETMESYAKLLQTNEIRQEVKAQEEEKNTMVDMKKRAKKAGGAMKKSSPKRKATAKVSCVPAAVCLIPFALWV